MIGTDLEAPWPRLAGVDADGMILILRADSSDLSTDQLSAFDPVTLRRVSGADIRLAGRATSAWVDGERLMWIDRHERLRVDGDRVAGRYTWVRSA